MLSLASTRQGDSPNNTTQVYDVEAPAEWDFRKYNGNSDVVYEWLSSVRPAPTTVRVPYRQNRCVLFNSNLFHRTDHLHFKPGYRTRRINVTLLYGKRQPPVSAEEHAARAVERERLAGVVAARRSTHK